MEYNIVGKGLPRKEALGKLVGETRFTGDVSLRGVLTARLLVSPYPHARIVGIDTSKAERVPGVKAILTAQDCPLENLGRQVKDRPILARGKVRYAGEPVAAIAAESEDIAEEATELITVEYEELPAVFDSQQAMKEGAVIIHEGLSGYKSLPKEPKHPTNILIEGHRKIGEPEAGFREADVIYEDTYTTPPVHQGYMERRETVVTVDSSGKATFWSSTKTPHRVKAGICETLGLSFNQVRVIATAVGGDFGGKGTVYLEPIAYLLALKSGRPVRLALSRREEFTSAFCRSSAVIYLKIGAKKDGTIVAFQGNIIYDTGAYCDSSVGEPIGNLFPPYRVSNLQMDGYVVYTNNPPRGHVRAPPAPHPLFAIESHIDMVAHKLGVDPLEFRLKNAVRDGDHLPQDLILQNSGLVKCLEVTQEYLRSKARAVKPNQGWGIAVSRWSVGKTEMRKESTQAYVRVMDDGTAVLTSGVSEQGGGQYSILSQIVAETLGIPYEAISVVAGDTDTTPFEFGASGSSVTWRLGAAVRLAAEEARDQLLDIAVDKLNVPRNAITLGNGKAYLKDSPGVSVSVADLVLASMNSKGVPIFGTGRRGMEEVATTMKSRANITDRPSFGIHAVRLEVDPETGHTRILDYMACHDVGFAINPRNVEGQIHGGVSMGIGYGLMEEVKLEQGQTMNPNFTDYRLPTSADMPYIETHIVEVPSDFGPFGAKGIGEPPAIAPAPAIANALYNAVGVRIRDLPLTPEKVFWALQKKASSEKG